MFTPMFTRSRTQVTLTAADRQIGSLGDDRLSIRE
jgi:hypothetical protein